MLKRLVIGLFLGAVVGIMLAAVLVQGLGMTTFGGSSLGATGAYLAAVVVGVLTGLVAGKPIWSSDGKIEAGLKAFFGALLALGGMFVLRQWVHVNVDLTALKASDGPAVLGDLPAVSLPIIAAVLAVFFEIDNTGPVALGAGARETERSGTGARAKGRGRVASATSADEEGDEEGDEDAAAPRAKQRR